ncbi:MAG: hypothetical protein JST91_00855 [Actinobacteria bacterium]|nr:hypothetical protein [Actinomycetota bacterium]
MARPKRRKTAQQQQQAATGEMIADYLHRRLTGQVTPRRGYRGPVDEGLLAQLKQRLAAALGRRP